MSQLFFKKSGSGPSLILLHGFCENGDIWEPIADELSESFTVYTPDLPGHGRSSQDDEIQSLDDISVKLLDWIDSEGIVSPAILGHSMGGYVTLAAVEKRPELFNRFGLIHSTAYADTQEKKLNRNKSIDFIKTHGGQAFFDVFIPGLYYKGGEWVGTVDKIVRKTSDETLVNYTAWMRDRPDQMPVLMNFDGPILFFGGKEDTFIPYETLEAQATFCKHPEIVILDEIGHLGMFEAPDRMANYLTNFLL